MALHLRQQPALLSKPQESVADRLQEPACNSYLCIKLPLHGRTHQKEIKIKTKNKVSQCMVKSANDKAPVGNLTQKVRLENYHNGNVQKSGAWFFPEFCRCHEWCNIHHHEISSDPIITTYITLPIQDSEMVSGVKCKSQKHKKIREKEEEGGQQQTCLCGKE